MMVMPMNVVIISKLMVVISIQYLYDHVCISELCKEATSDVVLYCIVLNAVSIITLGIFSLWLDVLWSSGVCGCVFAEEIVFFFSETMS